MIPRVMIDPHIVSTHLNTNKTIAKRATLRNNAVALVSKPTTLKSKSWLHTRNVPKTWILGNFTLGSRTKIFKNLEFFLFSLAIVLSSHLGGFLGQGEGPSTPIANLEDHNLLSKGGHLGFQCNHHQGHYPSLQRSLWDVTQPRSCVMFCKVMIFSSLINHHFGLPNSDVNY